MWDPLHCGPESKTWRVGSVCHNEKLTLESGIQVGHWLIQPTPKLVSNHNIAQISL